MLDTDHRQRLVTEYKITVKVQKQNKKKGEIADMIVTPKTGSTNLQGEANLYLSTDNKAKRSTYLL